MAATFALAAAETRRLFRSPLAWLVLALGQGGMAVMFLLLLVRYLEHEEQLRQAGVTSEIVVRYFVSADLAALFAMPVLTMATLAGDRALGLLRFWFSTPLGAGGIVIGKLLGVLALAATYVLLVSLMPATLYWGAPIDGGVYAANALGLALFTLFHACLGVLASALTRQPVAAALLALGVSLGLWLLDWAARLGGETDALGAWSTLTRLRSFGAGIVSAADVIYFLAASATCVVLAVLIVDAERRQP